VRMSRKRQTLRSTTLCKCAKAQNRDRRVVGLPGGGGYTGWVGGWVGRGGEEGAESEDEPEEADTAFYDLLQLR
jgi:hypothetical protein